jgi:hypothetical protein
MNHILFLIGIVLCLTFVSAEDLDHLPRIKLSQKHDPNRLLKMVNMLQRTHS